LHAAPGNVGIAPIAKCHEVALHDIDAITALAKRLKVGLVVVGNEIPLVAGLANRLKTVGIPCFGPSAAAARIEGSKVFAKELMDRAQVPTARWEAFSDVQAALAAINRWRGPVVIKADGLAAGKGVFVCMTKPQAERALTGLLVDSAFGVAGRRVIVEEFLQGVEASVAVITDGENIVPLPVVRGSKRLNDGDQGPNTDGMTAYLPCDDILFEDQIEEAIEAGLRPAIEDMAERGLPYAGALYADIMFTRSGPKVMEYNSRLGELEVQVLARSLGGDLLELMVATANGDISKIATPEIEFAAAGIALVSSTYPEKDEDDKQTAIGGLADVAELEGVEVFVGNAVQTGKGKTKGLASAGGRVLGVTATGDDVEEAVQRAEAAAELLTFDGMHRRRDLVSTVADAALA
jgi:phosphoribosylamine--glycine ligase